MVYKACLLCGLISNLPHHGNANAVKHALMNTRPASVLANKQGFAIAASGHHGCDAFAVVQDSRPSDLF